MTGRDDIPLGGRYRVVEGSYDPIARPCAVTLSLSETERQVLDSLAAEAGVTKARLLAMLVRAYALKVPVFSREEAEVLKALLHSLRKASGVLSRRGAPEAARGVEETASKLRDVLAPTLSRFSVELK